MHSSYRASRSQLSMPLRRGAQRRAAHDGKLSRDASGASARGARLGVRCIGDKKLHDETKANGECDGGDPKADFHGSFNAVF